MTVAVPLLDRSPLVPAFLAARGLSVQHIESFNYFVSTEIRNIVLAQTNRVITSDVDPKWRAEYTDVYFRPPCYPDGIGTRPTTPQMCRIRDMSYHAPILVDVTYVRGSEVFRKKGLQIGYMPVMLRSSLCALSQGTNTPEQLSECPNDPGGYFIINGTERVLLMQEMVSNNRIMVELDAKKQIHSVVTSSTADNKSRTLVCSKGDGRSSSSNGLFVKNSAFTDLIPLMVMLKGMGLESDQEVVELLGGGNSESPHIAEGAILCLQDAHSLGIFSQIQALDYMGSKLKLRYAPKASSSSSSSSTSTDTKIAEVLDVLVRQVLSHVDCNSSSMDFSHKARYLCVMARRVLDVKAGIGSIDDKDYYGNKRLELAGQLVALLFEDLFKTFNSDIKAAMDKQLVKYQQQKITSQTSSRRAMTYPDAFQAIPENRITQGLQRAISTGNWNLKRFRIDISGVSQVLSRFSYISCLGAMTRAKSQFDKGRKVAGPRALQPSQWGMLCPSDTPEGEQCGLVKHLSLLAHVTTPTGHEGALRSLCFALGVEDLSLIGGSALQRSTLVFFNGSIIGVHKNPCEFIYKFRRLRRQGRITCYVSIHRNDSQNCIQIASDGGRLCRPLIICENGRPMLLTEHIEKIKSKQLLFGDLLKIGVVEWVDVNEENDTLIALSEPEICSETTHLEIDPISLLGVVAGLVPYPHHNQSPRNTYQCAMGKQAMGAIANNQWIRTDTLLLTLVYPQKPMCRSRSIELIGWENLPAGQNASVAVMSYSGYDIEDAIVMNCASLDRGFGRCGYLRRYECELERVGGLLGGVGGGGRLEEVRGPPPVGATDSSKARRIEEQRQQRKYGSIEDDGTVRVGDLVFDGSILANKYTPTVDGSGGWVENSVRYKSPVESYVDRVIWTQNDQQEVNIKIMARQTRRPELGDKFSSRHGQKGVCGLIVPQEDMPFAETGWCPDLIMNPHGFPSRMTVGKMLELIAGKGGVMVGKRAYGTVFGGTTRDEISLQLLSRGFNPCGKDFLTSGITGEPLECYIFQGPIYYQKLKHMVMDKIHARSLGQRQALTRQPTEGRSRDGGLRLGEMERDCLVAYGASNLLLERLMLSSDVFNAPVCQKCGLIAQKDWCNLCKSSRDVVSLRMPYACKLLFQELQGMNVCPRLRLEHR